MTNPNYTALLFIIDESGSMYSIAKDMEGGINTLLEEQSKLPGKLTVDVAYFDTNFRYPTSLVAAADADIKIVPKGGTSLHDAIVQATSKFGETLSALPEDERPGTVMAVIVTDGHENSSREATKADVKALITEQQDTYNWSYVFLGANQDAVLAGESFGLRKGASLTYDASTIGVANASTLLSNYATTTRSGGIASFTNA
jgi:Mg-chelatase subunit ChlD